MLLKILFLAIVLYYVVKTSRALIRAVTRNVRPQEPQELRDERTRSAARGRSATWDGDAAKRPDYDDVEDAKYVDI